MIDLHLHLDGSLAPADVIVLARQVNVDLPTEDEQKIGRLLMVEPGCRNLKDYLTKFKLPLRVLQFTETIELSVYRLLRRLSLQGLCYAEIRFAPQLHTDMGLSQEEVVKSAICGLKKGICDFGMPAKLIL